MAIRNPLTRRATPSVDTSRDAPAPAGPSPLIEQAQAFANVAHQALEDCEAADAEAELHRRRNTSGQ